MLRTMPLKSAALSMTIWLTPAFSVKTWAWRALASIQLPLAGLPVKSMILTSGRKASCWSCLVVQIVDDEGDDVGVEAGFFENVADDLHADGERQYRGGMGLDDHRVAGGERGEEAGVAIPGGEGCAADDEADSARDDAEFLAHFERLVLALGLFPVRFGGYMRHLFPGAGDGFQGAVLGVRATSLEGHNERLAGGVHDGVGDFRSCVC